jgi:hypothetical protein
VDELYYLLLKSKTFLAQPNASENPGIVDVELVAGLNGNLVIAGYCLLLILANTKNFE